METRRCQTVGCENDVPRPEWPADRTWPILCDPCLRATAWVAGGDVTATATAVVAEHEPESVDPAPAAADFGAEDSADFG